MNVSGDFTWKSRLIKPNNSPLFPNNLRALIIGKSNSGKSVLIFNLLLQHGWLDYNHLFVFAKTLHQTEYLILQKGFEIGLSKQQIANIFRNQDAFQKVNLNPVQVIDQYTGERKGDIKAEFYADCNMVPDPSELKCDEKNFLLLDDCFLGSQNKIEAYYTRGRQNNCQVAYISQSYFRLPRHSVRENMNFLIMFPQDSKNLQHIYADHCDRDMSLAEFKRFCQAVWSSGPHHFVILDLTSDKWNGRYRKNLDCFYIPTDQTDKKEVDELINSIAS